MPDQLLPGSWATGRVSSGVGNCLPVDVAREVLRLGGEWGLCAGLGCPQAPVFYVKQLITPIHKIVV